MESCQRANSIVEIARFYRALASARLQGGESSMGYDPYDFYDLGNINQKGTTKTWFGSKDELLGLIAGCIPDFL